MNKYMNPLFYLIVLRNATDQFISTYKQKQDFRQQQIEDIIRNEEPAFLKSIQYVPDYIYDLITLSICVSEKKEDKIQESILSAKTKGADLKQIQKALFRGESNLESRTIDKWLSVVN